MSRRPTRRQFVGVGVGGVAAVGLGGAFWADLLGSAEGGRLAGGGGYGPRGAPDAHGLRLPEGFRARVVVARPRAGGRERLSLARGLGRLRHVSR